MIQAHVLADQVRTLYRQSPVVLVANCVNTVIVSSLAWASGHHRLLLAWLGSLAFWGNVAESAGGTQADGTEIPSSVGWALGVKHLLEHFGGGYQNLLIAYGKGIAQNFR